VSLLVEQFDLVWSLASLHLDALVEDDFLWQPTSLVWTVHHGDDGLWRPDFAEVELDPIPVPTIAWLTWHIDWWWSTALAHASGQVVPGQTDVYWAGSGAVPRLRTLAADWRALLTDADFTRPLAYPWDPPKTMGHTASWVNVELMKNVAEIGQLRLLRAAELTP
jgi:hypothetical protein